MSSITQAKAEAQKLIRRYNQLQAEAKTTDNMAEAARKAAEADKLVSQISALQLAITKLQAKDRQTTAKKPIATTGKATTSKAPITANNIKHDAASEKIALEERMNHLEEAQKKTRAQIEQLTRAKSELTRLKHEAEKSVAHVAKERRTHDEKLQQELAKLIAKKEAEHQAFKQELDAVRQQAQKDAELLKVQRDAARAMMEKHKQLEKEQSLVLHQKNSSNKKWFIGLSIVAIFALILGVLLALLFTPVTKHTNNAPVMSLDNSESVDKPTVEKPPKMEQPDMEAIKMYRDQLKDGQGPLMVELPGGTFNMGSKNSLPYQDERPQHEVTLEKFSISQYEVTFEEYDWFAWATGRKLPNDRGWGRGKRPVINVSWYDAVEYAKWLSSQTNYNYRLPSEREWEYAATAGTQTLYWWGYKLEKNKANCGICGSPWDGKKTAPVGSFLPNSFGIYDTIGNVMEWTMSCFHPSYQGAPSTGQLWEGGDCSKRVVRSSSFKSYENSLRTTKRQNFSPETRIETLGFRVVRFN